MRIDIITIFPEMFAGVFTESILKRAQGQGSVEINFVNFRDFSMTFSSQKTNSATKAIVL